MTTRREAALVGTLYLLLALSAFAPALATGRWMFGTDTVGHDLPVFATAWSRSLAAGRFQLWDDRLRGGLPAVGAFAFAPFYPPNWLQALAVAATGNPLAGGAAEADPFAADRLWRAYAWMHTLQWPLHHALGGLFMYLFVAALMSSDRPIRWGVLRMAPFAAGLVYATAPHIVTLTYAGHLAKVQAIAWLPAVLWLLTTRDETQSPCRPTDLPAAWARPAAAGVALAMPMLAGHPQIFAYGVGLAAAWCLWQGLQPVRWRLDDVGAFCTKSLGALAVALVVAAALAAPQALAGAEMRPHSNRAQLPYDEATKSSYPPIELPELLVAHHRGTSVRPDLGGAGWYRGPWGERIVTDYLGVVAVALALIGLTVTPRAPEMVHAGGLRGLACHRWFFGGVFLFGIVHGLGGHLGAYYETVWRTVPFAASFRSPATIMVLMPLALAPLAGMGAVRLVGGLRLALHACTCADAECWRMRRYLPLLLVPLATILVLLFLVVSRRFGDLSRFVRAEPTLRDDVLRAFAVAAAWALALPLAFWFAWMLTQGRLLLAEEREETAPGEAPPRTDPAPACPRERHIAGAFGFLALALLVLDASRANRAYLRPVPEDTLVAQWRAAPAGPARVLEAAPTPFSPALWQRGRELGLAPLVRGWAVPWGYHPIYFRRQQQALTRLGFDHPVYLDLAGVAAVATRDGALRGGPARLLPDTPFRLAVAQDDGNVAEALLWWWAESGTPEEVLAVVRSDELPAELAEHRLAQPASAWRRFEASRFAPNAARVLMSLPSWQPVGAGAPAGWVLPVPAFPGFDVAIEFEAGGRLPARWLVPVNFVQTLALWPAAELNPYAGGLVRLTITFRPASHRGGVLLAALGLLFVAATTASWATAARRSAVACAEQPGEHDTYAHADIG